MQNKVVLVLSGFNQRAVIGFLRVLESNSITYAIIALSNTDPILLTKYKNRVLSVRKSVPLLLDDIISCICEVKERIKQEEFIIAPSTEALNRFLLQNRLEFEKQGCIIPLVNKELYELISDKKSFGLHCHKNGILTPGEFNVNHRIVYPCVAKPKKYFSSKTGEILTPVIIHKEIDFEIFKKKFLVDDFYFQEFVFGSSFYLLYYFHRNGSVFRFSQENSIQQPGGKSIVAAISSTFHTSPESKKYEMLFISLKFYGLVMVEVKQYRDQFFMIEANPRFWGPSQLFVDAKMNLFEAFLHDFGVLKTLPSFTEPEKKFRYFWFGGIMESYKQKIDLTFYQGNDHSLLKDLPDWISADIYRRNDTMNIFKNEIV